MAKKILFLILKIFLISLDLSLVPNVFGLLPFLLTPIVLAISFRKTVEGENRQRQKEFLFLLIFAAILFDLTADLKFGFWLLAFLTIYLLGLGIGKLVSQKSILMLIFTTLIFSVIILVSNYPHLSITFLLTGLTLELVATDVLWSVDFNLTHRNKISIIKQ